MAPHTQAAHAHKQSRGCSSSFPSLCYSAQIGTCSHAKGDVPCFPNHKALCQRIKPLMNKVRTHEARVSHTIAPTILRHPSGGKYTLVSKCMVHQSLTHIYLHRTWSCKFLLPLFAFVCSGLRVFSRYSHRLFKLSMVLRSNSLL